MFIQTVHTMFNYPDDPFWTSDQPGSGADCRGALAASKVPVYPKCNVRM